MKELLRYPVFYVYIAIGALSTAAIRCINPDLTPKPVILTMITWFLFIEFCMLIVTIVCLVVIISISHFRNKRADRSS